MALGYSDSSTTCASCNNKGLLGVATESATPPPARQFTGVGGFTWNWDGCSSTPFLHSGGVWQVVAYDDPASLEIKVQLARQVGMRGMNMFDIHGNTDPWDLADALQHGLRLA